MPVIAKSPPMRQAPRSIIRKLAVQNGLNSKIHLAVDAHGMPVRVAVTAATTADWTQTAALIDGITARFLLTDLGYDSNEIIDIEWGTLKTFTLFEAAVKTRSIAR